MICPVAQGKAAESQRFVDAPRQRAIQHQRTASIRVPAQLSSIARRVSRSFSLEISRVSGSAGACSIAPCTSAFRQQGDHLEKQFPGNNGVTQRGVAANNRNAQSRGDRLQFR